MSPTQQPNGPTGWRHAGASDGPELGGAKGRPVGRRLEELLKDHQA